MKTKLALCTVLTALLPLVAHAQTAPAAAAPVALRLKFTPGDTQHYRLTMNMTMNMSMSGQTAAPAAIPPMQEQMIMTYDTTVQSVNPADGSATLLEHITQMTGTMNGRLIPGLDAMTGAYKDGFTVVMAPNGKMLSMKMPPSAAGKLPAGMDLSKMGSLAPSTLPADPVKVGDTWNGDMDMSQMLGQVPGAPAVKMSIQSMLAGLSTGAQTIANVQQTYNGALGGAAPTGAAGTIPMTGKFSGTGLLKFDVTGGSIASQNTNLSMNLTMGLPKTSASSTAAPQTMKMQMQMATHLLRLPAAPPA